MILEYHDNDYCAQVKGIQEAASKVRSAHQENDTKMRNYWLRVLLCWIDHPHEMVANFHFPDSDEDWGR